MRIRLVHVAHVTQIAAVAISNLFYEYGTGVVCAIQAVHVEALAAIEGLVAACGLCGTRICQGLLHGIYHGDVYRGRVQRFVFEGARERLRIRAVVSGIDGMRAN